MSGAGVAEVLVRPIARAEVDRFNAELDAHHWLGHRLTGQVMRYVAVLDGQWVALVGFGSAALHCAARDGTVALVTDATTLDRVAVAFTELALAI